MPVIPMDRLLREPPGKRRALLALGNQGLNLGHVAIECNCDRTTVSRVLAAPPATGLHRRLRRVLADLAGQPEAWLFEHVDQPEAQGSPVGLPAGALAS